MYKFEVHVISLHNPTSYSSDLSYLIMNKITKSIVLQNIEQLKVQSKTSEFNQTQPVCVSLFLSIKIKMLLM